VPVGVIGELYIGGDGVARGYWGHGELTAAKFVPDPYGGVAGARLYRTGDLVKWDRNRRLEFIGRADHQVKIHGFRIELGEIETVLLEHASVKHVAVVARAEAGEKQLVAYVVANEPGATGRGSQLREYLLARLPEYMVPAMYVELEKLPLTANGKVDRKALPDPDRTSDSAAYVPPRTLQEEMLCGVMEQILDIQPIGIRHNFFQLGGHSLLATQVVSRIRNLFGLELPLRILFEKPTVGEVAGELERLRMEGHELPVPAIKPRDRSRGLPLSFAQ